MMSKVASVLACLSFAWALAGQQAHKVGRSTAGARTGACDCLQFDAVYYDNLASCGRASELYFHTKNGASQAYTPTEPIAGLPHQVCANFFKNLKNNSCLNRDLYSFPLETSDVTSNQSWCYVSNDCLPADLNGGTYATNPLGFAIGGWHNQVSTSNLSWKICDPDGDDVLRNKNMEALIAIGVESDVGMALLLKYAYPAVSITWGEAQEFMEMLDTNWNDQLTAGENFNQIAAPSAIYGTRLQWIYTTLSSIVNTEKCWILDSPGHRDEFHVICGRQVWSVTRIEEGNMAYMAGKFYLEFTVACIQACSPTTREAALDLLTQ